MGVALAALPALAATAGATGTAALGAGSLATGLSAAGSLLTGVGDAQKALFAAKVAEANAITARRAGQSAEEASKLKYGALEAEQKAAQAANGIDVGSGSAVAVRQSTAEIGSIDAAMIHYNAARDSYAYRAQASQDKQSAVMAGISGVLGAGNTILGGVNSTSDKWAAFKQKGVV